MSWLSAIAAGGFVNAWAFLAAVVAAFALGLRSHMLRPEFHTLCDAPPLVWGALSFLGIVCAGYALTIAGGYPASAREAVLLSALAIAAVVLFLNLRRQAHAGGSAP